MPDPNGRRRPSKLSAETKWEIFLQVTAGEISQAEAARKWHIDVSTVIGIRRTVKDAALAALARKPGRPGTQRDWQLEAARAEIAQMTEAVKAQAIELSVDRAPGGHPVHALLSEEIAAILDVAERWGTVDRSHRKLAHRGSYEHLVWVSPATFRRVLIEHGLTLPEPAPCTRTEKRPWPDWLVWEPNRIWIWDATHFTRARRVCFAIVDMVSRKWIDTLVSVEEPLPRSR